MANIQISGLPAKASFVATDKLGVDDGSNVTWHVTGTQMLSYFNSNITGNTGLVTLGTVATGTWQGSLVSPVYGGTGVANLAGSTITLGGALTFSGAFTTAFTVTGNTALTLPTSGTLATTSQLPTLPLSGANGGTGTNNGTHILSVSGDFKTTGSNNLTLNLTGNTAVTLPLSGTLLSNSNNLSDVSNKTTSFDNISPLTTKGDILSFNGTNNIRIPVGTNGYVITADSTQAAGWKWANVSIDLPLTTKGDLLVYDGISLQRLRVGSDSYVVTADSTQPLGVKWSPASTGASFLDNAIFVGTAGQSVSSSTPTPVNLTTIIESTAGNTWTTNGDNVGMKCGRSGSYFFTGICPVESQSATLANYGVLYMRFAKNGTVVGPMIPYNMPVPANGGAVVIPPITCTAIIDCSVNDVITFCIYSGTAAATYTVPDPGVTGGLHTAQVSIVRLT